MEFSVDNKAFLDELSLVQGVVERRHAIPILSNVRFSAKGGEVSLYATDLEVSYESRVKAEVRKEGEILIPSRMLYEALGLAGDNKVRVKKTDKDGVKVFIENGSTYKFVEGDIADFPNVPEDKAKKGKCVLDAGMLDAMLRLTSFAASREMSRYAINGVLLNVGKKSLKVVATDGYRLSIIERKDAVKSAGEEGDVIIPQKGVRELQRLLSHGGEVSMHRDENQIFFELGARKLAVRAINDAFPNYERVIPKDNDKSIRFSRAHLVQAIKAASVVLSDAARPVRFEFSHNTLAVVCENQETGEARHEMSISYTGEEFGIGFKPAHLLEFLGIIAESDVMISLKGESDQALLEPVFEGEKPYDLRYVVMPMRL
jgi:DNA polymerase-3 subunit beta